VLPFGNARAPSGTGVADAIPRGANQEHIVAIEHARTRAVRKPWGSTDLVPWSEIQSDGAAVGELWFQRPDAEAPASALLLKLLLTREPLSIQVHPDDAFARSIGLANGKTEAWYILSATPEAQVAVGLKRQVTAAQLRASIEDGSITELIRWQGVKKDDVVYVPAGTIHAIGAGLVLAEIQQNSDTTFRLFDHGRQREIHAGNAVAAARPGPAACQAVPQRLTDARSLLVTSPYFVLERIDLPPNSSWSLNAERETWLMVIEGGAQIGLLNAFVGEAIFVEADHASVRAGSRGLKGLLAYVGPAPIPSLLQNLDRQDPACQPARSHDRATIVTQRTVH
jgi:mannose-6-phosphate isomerase